MKKVNLFFLVILIFGIKNEEEQPVSMEELQDRAHFEDFDIHRQFLIVDVDPATLNSITPKGYYYYFNMLSNKPSDPNQTPNKFYFDMFYYNQPYSSDPIGPTIDHSSLATKTPQSISLEDHIVTNIKLNNNFFKAEVSISKNNCLTLFLFIDSQEKTDMTLFERRHDFLFDMSSSSNNFYASMVNYFGHARDSFELIYNDIESSEENIYLKALCPYFSVFGEKSIDLTLTLIPHDEPFSCKN